MIFFNLNAGGSYYIWFHPKGLKARRNCRALVKNLICGKLGFKGAGLNFIKVLQNVITGRFPVIT